MASHCGAVALGTASVVVAHEIFYSEACEIFPGEGSTPVPGGIGTRILIYWATREVPSLPIKVGAG